MLKEYIRDTAFFQSVRDRNIPITAKELDLEFNNVINYINKKIKPLVETLANKQIPGIADNAGMFLQNVGDGTTRFARVDSSTIPNYSLSLQKFANITPSSIVASANNNIFVSVASLANNQILSSRLGNIPVWKLAGAENFENNTIPSGKIALATLTANHLVPGIIGRPLDDNSVETRHIQDGIFSANYLQERIFDNTRISNALMGTRVADLTFKDNSIIARHIPNNSINYQLITNRGQLMPLNKIPNNSVVYPATGDWYCSTIVKRPDGSWPPGRNPFDNSTIGYQGAFMAYHIRAGSFDITRDTGTGGVPRANIGKHMLSPELRARLKQGGLN